LERFCKKQQINPCAEDDGAIMLFYNYKSVLETSRLSGIRHCIPLPWERRLPLEPPKPADVIELRSRQKVTRYSLKVVEVEKIK
jgi:hypothetical protein